MSVPWTPYDEANAFLACLSGDPEDAAIILACVFPGDLVGMLRAAGKLGELVATEIAVRERAATWPKWVEAA